MAEVDTQSLPSLSKEYFLPAEEKPVESKPIEVEKVETPASATPEEVTPDKTEEAPPAVEEESVKAPSAPEVESNDAPVDAVQEESAPVAEENTESTEPEESAPIAEENTESTEPEESASEEASEDAPEVKLETAPADFRFPTTNQTRHCFTRYVEYHRCIAAKGEDAPECDKFAKFYRSLCPGEWVDRWNEQRENGSFPGPL